MTASNSTVTSKTPTSTPCRKWATPTSRASPGSPPARSCAPSSAARSNHAASRRTSTNPKTKPQAPYAPPCHARSNLCRMTPAGPGRCRPAPRQGDPVALRCRRWLEQEGLAMTTTVTALAQDIGLARETDYFLMTDQLTEDELGLLYRVRKFGETEILPVVNPYWERGEFPFELVPKLAELNIVGDTMAGYGTTPMSAGGSDVLAYELSRVDGSIATFFSVHVGLAMQSIYLLGSDGQKQRGLPPMARLEKVGAFALTEPDHGSDAVILEATARRDGSEWVINGRKRWPGNAVWCDVIVVFARDTQDGQVKAFVVEKDNPGYAASKIEGKVSLRLVQSSDITLTDCRVSDDARLQNCNSFADVAKVRKCTRNTVASRQAGLGSPAYDIALNYAQRRTQFGRPIAKNQMIQSGLVEMLGQV